MALWRYEPQAKMIPTKPTRTLNGLGLIELIDPFMHNVEKWLNIRALQDF